ncbi:triose-phosphate isomerase [Alicyclobacillus sp. SP_1]|uniref:triose-phosphate isomerase n=1 Tax=Alicyclobacillus sp. SP_1 TaxID=2942475 RepID=UPI002157AAE4|nr:triose-phosphate isomerase [Alicyclobacillus sp. SP_1]
MTERRPLLIGNWKMYKTLAEARSFAQELGQQSTRLCMAIDYGICAPFTSLHLLRVMLPAQVRIGAQDVYYETEGAFTGEISAPMLADFGTHFVLVGHSERRSLFGESNAMVAKKAAAVLRHGMVPVVCVGESLAERERGETLAVVLSQLDAVFDALADADIADFVVAYEPVWAIGSGKTATVNDAGEVASAIRTHLATIRSAEFAANLRILYGGSVKPGNIASFLEHADIDGALVGGASLEANSFADMAEAAGGCSA